ncbi:GDYXXLXY domain-containing protein [Limibacter armeniacum]|uniref:GDYXXLXY domain-containing protein n=1 Tax=Limibacter armeniacum TaxID=466084 RepID=UPI002FE697C2
MRKYKEAVILLNLVVLILFFNYSIVEKENILEDGELILLELAPVDPRSLMQGDYMRLNYKMSNDLGEDELLKRGYCVVKLDQNGVAERVRLQESVEPVGEGEYLIKYTEGEWRNRINIGASSFFFQEGEASKYDQAKYGGLRVDKKGNSVLTGLYDKQLKKIE